MNNAAQAKNLISISTSTQTTTKHAGVEDQAKQAESVTTNGTNPYLNNPDLKGVDTNTFAGRIALIKAMHK